MYYVLTIWQQKLSVDLFETANVVEIIPLVVGLVYFVDCVDVCEFIICNFFLFSFPEIAFFKDEALRSLMSDILFCYARGHVNVEYKQVGVVSVLCSAGKLTEPQVFFCRT